MKTMFFSGKHLPVKDLLRSHCPLMLRAKYEEGKNQADEDVLCRCDFTQEKKSLGLGQCSSRKACPVREHPDFDEGGSELRYEKL
jgi:hypothetical protein